MAWLKLTKSDRAAVYVNADHVVRITAVKPNGSALLTDVTDKGGGPIVIRVRESPSEISDMLRQGGPSPAAKVLVGRPPQAQAA